MSDPGRDLLALVPRISRARGFRLYTDGGRLVDLWQYGGAAALGHTAPGVLLAFKDSASRGLFAPFPHAAAARLEKTLLRLVPGYSAVRLYVDAASADAALASAGLAPLCCRDLADPATADLPAGTGAALWRPWVPDSTSLLPSVAAPVIPLPWSARPVAFLLDQAFADRFPPSDVLSPVVLTASCRAADDLIAALPLRSQLRFRHTDNALSGSEPAWCRRGPYLRLARQPTADEYASLFRVFLESGFLLPPDSSSPAILPLELSPGEDARLAALLSRATSEIL